MDVSPSKGRPQGRLQWRVSAHRLWRQFSDSSARLFPACCLVCGRASQGVPDLCAACRQWLPLNRGRVCIRCGRWFGASCRPAAFPAMYCSACAETPWVFSRTIVPWRYQEPLSSLIRGLKYQARRQHARVLGELLADEVVGIRGVQTLPEALLSVPMPPVRWRRRGFDHAGEIAHWCARRLQLPLLSAAVTRRQETVSLAGLNRSARQAAIAGAFACRIPLRGSHIAIVDDVLTTGATCTELARELLDNGVRTVELWVVARTPAREWSIQRMDH